MTADAEGKLLIITGSHDSTVDFLLAFLPADRVFRLNTDLLQKYTVVFDSSGFALTDPTGRGFRSREVYKAYWRWPEWPVATTKEQRYVRAEVRYLLREIKNLLWSEDKFVLVEPEALQRSGKLLQLIRACEYFNVPPFRAVLNSPQASGSGTEVVKSLAKALPEPRAIYSTRVDPSELAPEYPWFMQRYVEAVFDVTVVVVRKRLFAFELARDFLATSIDWREIPDKTSAWTPMELSEPTGIAILRYMDDLHLDFGRLDFLKDENGQMYFCEVNPNPQFDWLDYEGKRGLVSAVLEELSPMTERHSIPVRHPLAATMEI
jgi:hypothetical protein